MWAIRVMKVKRKMSEVGGAVNPTREGKLKKEDLERETSMPHYNINLSFFIFAFFASLIFFVLFTDFIM